MTFVQHKAVHLPTPSATIAYIWANLGLLWYNQRLCSSTFAYKSPFSWAAIPETGGAQRCLNFWDRMREWPQVATGEV